MEEKGKQNIIQIVKGVCISILITLILLLIYSAILTYTKVSEITIHPVIITITGISILIGSMLANRKMSKNGMLNGGIIGGIYILTFYLSSSVLNNDFSLNMYSIIMIAISVILGMIGGIIGINKK